jgi:nucleotide-binding universal stress UspA family protein
MASTALRIVAGYDGSSDSAQALDWAVREARLHETGLTVCHAWTPGPDVPGGSAARRSADQLLDDAMCRARAGIGCAEIQPLLAAGSPAQVLCELSNDAAMVVVGSRAGVSAWRGLRSGQ